MDRLPVVLVTNDRYAAFAATASRSLLDNTADPTRIEIHLLHTDLAARNRERLGELVEGSGARLLFHDVGERVEADEAYRGLTPHFHRLLAPEILPTGVDRFVYLDSDLLVRGDLRDLFAMPLGGRTVATCQDYIGTFAQAVANHRELGVPGTTPYFNSGVMLVDRDLWQADRVSERVLECTRRNERHLYAQGKFFQYDQYALNVVLRDAVVLLDMTWNHGAEYPYRDCRIVHFNGHGKPWSPTCSPEFRDEFHSVLARTGWRPDELPRPSTDVA